MIDPLIKLRKIGKWFIRVNGPGDFILGFNIDILWYSLTLRSVNLLDLDAAWPRCDHFPMDSISQYTSN